MIVKRSCLLFMNNDSGKICQKYVWDHIRVLMKESVYPGNDVSIGKGCTTGKRESAVGQDDGFLPFLD